ncbi:MAG TPA: Fic family protein [Vicinamibacterales bacterium]|nr:Fic family protein [Vicinamibacterales bacterium]
MNTTYIHELPDWRAFRWDHARLAAPLAAARHLQGRLIGQMAALGCELQEQAILGTLTTDVLESSEIEGEQLDADQVRSSVARRLGLEIAGLVPADRRVDGVVEMMLDATQRYDQPLTTERLFGWHAALFPTGRSGMHPIMVGAWRGDRSSPMQVVSGPVGRERVHFEAPAAARLDREMRSFIEWFNGDSSTEPVLKAAKAHLWFVTVHPFDDGNGRIARAIADMALARSEESAHRFYSMSAQIRQERAGYYRILEETQQGSMDITPWMMWFLDCLTRAIARAQSALSGVIAKGRYWEKLRAVTLNERQRQMIARLLDGFDGKLTTSKWAALTKSSQDTALRDIQQLVDRGVLMRNAAGGRSTSYALAPL